MYLPGYLLSLFLPTTINDLGYSATQAQLLLIPPYVVAAGVFLASAIVLSWPANNVSTQTKRATAHAMQISIGNLGAALGTQLYRPKWSLRHFVGHSVVQHFAILIVRLNNTQLRSH